MLLSIGSVFISIISFIFVFGAIVLLHEGGHFYFATKAGILCREYAFGMGPLLWHRKKGETQYSIRAFPIGGYCAIAGEEKEQDPLDGKDSVRLLIEDNIVKKIYFEVDCPLFNDIPLYKLVKYDLYDENNTGNLFMTVLIDDQEVTYRVDNKAYYVYSKKGHENDNALENKEKLIEEMQIAPFNRQMNSKSIWKRFLVVFGGPLVNILLALVAFVISCLITGVSDSSSTRLGKIDETMPAYVCGLREGDVITKMEYLTYSKEIEKWNDISIFMTEFKNDKNASEVKIYFERDGENKEVVLKPMVFIYSISMYQDIESDEVKVAPLNKGSKAYKGGIREGDIITSVNGTSVSTWKDVYYEFGKVEEAKQNVEVKVLRDGKEEVCEVVPYSKKLFAKTQNVNYVEMSIGISPVVTRNLFQCIKAAFMQLITSVVQLYCTLWLLITSSEVGLRDMSGVIGIFSLTSDAAQSGFGTLLYWMGYLSINVGVVNLLPIPALDGGRILFLIIEAITGKPVSQKAQDISINVTMILLFILMGYVAIFDILRLV